MRNVKLVITTILLAVTIMCSLSYAQTIDRPIPTSARIPAYPAMAQAKRISGAVLVDVKVNAEGKVIEAEPLLGDEYLRGAAKAASLLWQFKPFESAASPYTVRLTFIFHDVSYRPSEKKPDYRSPYQIEILYPVGTGDCFDDCP
jgi:TonB family protein